MKIAIANDHAAVEYKHILVNHLRSKGHEVVNFGTDESASCDYPDYAKKVALAVQKNEVDAGVLICGTGIGMSISANRYKGIRSICANDPVEAFFARKDEDANVLTIGARFVSFRKAIKIIQIFLTSEFEGGRHERRIAKY